MRYYLIAIIVAFVILCAFGLWFTRADVRLDTNFESKKIQPRIIGRQHVRYHDAEYQIIEIDSVQYLITYTGYAIPLIKNNKK